LKNQSTEYPTEYPSVDTCCPLLLRGGRHSWVAFDGRMGGHPPLPAAPLPRVVSGVVSGDELSRRLSHQLSRQPSRQLSTISVSVALTFSTLTLLSLSSRPTSRVRHPSSTRAARLGSSLQAPARLDSKRQPEFHRKSSSRRKPDVDIKTQRASLSSTGSLRGRKPGRRSRLVDASLRRQEITGWVSVEYVRRV
jgi:hypothetical protein